MSDKTLKLGELQTVANTLRDHKFEADELIVGHIMIDDDVKAVAFTKAELERPVKRGEKNREDLPAMEVRPPEWDDVEKLKKKLDEATTIIEKLKSRGLIARLLNRGV